MSRTSKIPSRHVNSQFPANDCTFSIIADPRLPRNLTTPEQAEWHQAAALAKQSVRRVGKTIEQRKDDGWVLKQSYRYVNEAKRANRPFVAAKAR